MASSGSGVDLKEPLFDPLVKIIAGSSRSIQYIHRRYLASSASQLLRDLSEEQEIDWTAFDEITIDHVIKYLLTGSYPVLTGDGAYCYTGTVGREQAAWEERTGIKEYRWIDSNHAYGIHQAMCDAVSKGGNVGLEMMHQAGVFGFAYRYSETWLEKTALARLLVAFQVLVGLKMPLFPYLGNAVRLIYDTPSYRGQLVISSLVAKNLLRISSQELDTLLKEEVRFARDVKDAFPQIVREHDRETNRHVILGLIMRRKLNKMRS